MAPVWPGVRLRTPGRFSGARGRKTRRAQRLLGTCDFNPQGGTALGPCRHARRKSTMLKLALFFAVVAVIAAVFGFTGVAAGAAAIAKILFFIFVVLCVVFLVIGFVVTKKIVD
jgi:uncharacterized membrane protein YtjA (UPF0391 family)